MHMRRTWKGKLYWMLCLALSALFLSGCGGTELENKAFPLAVLVSGQDGQLTVCYLSQQLSEVANERADGGNMTAASAAGSTYYETHKTFEKNNRCQLDVSHTKAVVFQKGFIESGALPLFLDTVRSENMYARNTLVYVSDSSMEQLAELNTSLEIPLGSYLEQMTENEQDIRKQAAVTLGTLLNEQANASRTLLLPVLREENGLPQIYEYEALQDFEVKGRVGTKDAQIHYLLEGQLQQMDLHLDAGEQVRLSRLKCKREFVLNNGRVTEQIILRAEAEHITGSASQMKMEQMLQERITNACQDSQETLGLDLSDSSRCLALYAPDIYRLYGKCTDEYRKILDYEAQIQIHVV